MTVDLQIHVFLNVGEMNGTFEFVLQFSVWFVTILHYCVFINCSAVYIILGETHTSNACLLRKFGTILVTMYLI